MHAMTQILQKFGIVGGGAWGTALALCALRAGREVLLWAKDPETVADINERHENVKRLPGVTLDQGLRATSNLADMSGADALILAVPAQKTRAVCRDLKKVNAAAPLILAAKGIELG